MMKTRGEIEAAIGDGMRRLQQEYIGRAPKDIQSFLIGDLVEISLQSVLTAADQQLVQSQPTEKGIGLLKQVRMQLIETALRSWNRWFWKSPASRLLACTTLSAPPQAKRSWSSLWQSRRSFERRRGRNRPTVAIPATVLPAETFRTFVRGLSPHGWCQVVSVSGVPDETSL